MKIVTSREMRLADEDTFTRLLVPSRAVMEVAGREVARWIREESGIGASGRSFSGGVLVVAGGGNNGGDGYVVARSLLAAGYPVRVLAQKPVAALSGDGARAAASFQASGGLISEYSEATFSGIRAALEEAPPELVVDALYGTGFQGPARGDGAVLIACINSLRERRGSLVVAVDLPSGVGADSGELSGETVRADVTIALQALKPAHVLFPASERCGDILVVDIGVHVDDRPPRSIEGELITETMVHRLLAAHDVLGSETHKGKRGHVLVIGGSAGHYGAPSLSANAALHAGAGLVTIVLPRSAAERAGPQMREIMCASLPDDGEGAFSGTGTERLEALLEGKGAIVVGPGLGTNEGAERLLTRLFSALKGSQIPLILDADGLNLVARSEEIRAALPPGSVLTPHPGEMARLVGAETSAVQRDRIRSALGLSSSVKCTVVLKGARTVIAGPGGGLYVNPSAEGALATAGAGDVLAGLIGAFTAQGFPPLDAARIAVFSHGASGELLAHRGGGPYGVLANDIGETVPHVLNALRSLGDEVAPPSFRPLLPGSLHRTLLS